MKVLVPVNKFKLLTVMLAVSICIYSIFFGFCLVQSDVKPVGHRFLFMHGCLVGMHASGGYVMLLVDTLMVSFGGNSHC